MHFVITAIMLYACIQTIRAVPVPHEDLGEMTNPSQYRDGEVRINQARENEGESSTGRSHASSVHGAGDTVRNRARAQELR